MSDFKPRYAIKHDYGGSPANRDGVFNPYNALVFPDGSVRYRNPSDPYGVRAPHAYKMNPHSVGLSYAGPVGSKPTPEAMGSLNREWEAIQKRWPGIQSKGHGEAYAETRGTRMQASKHGRDMIEASWRKNLGQTTAAPATAAAPPPAPATPQAAPQLAQQAQQRPLSLIDHAFGRQQPPPTQVPAPVLAQRPPSPDMANPSHMGYGTPEPDPNAGVPALAAPRPANGSQQDVDWALGPAPQPEPQLASARPPLPGRMGLGAPPPTQPPGNNDPGGTYSMPTQRQAAPMMAQSRAAAKPPAGSLPVNNDPGGTYTLPASTSQPMDQYSTEARHWNDMGFTPAPTLGQGAPGAGVDDIFSKMFSGFFK